MISYIIISDLVLSQKPWEFYIDFVVTCQGLKYLRASICRSLFK